jgi:hypothetical protein
MEILTPETTSVICPDNDGEGKTIIEIATRLSFDVRVSPQPWGATLAREPEGSFVDLRQHLMIVEIPGPAKERELRKSHKVYIIDHHQYHGLDRFHAQSSLEQFSELIGYRLNRWEMGIALNDRGYIHALRKKGYTQEEIQDIRQFDLIAQGYCKDDFRRTEQEYAAGSRPLRDFYLVETRSDRISYFMDIHLSNSHSNLAPPSLIVLQEDERGMVKHANCFGPPTLVKTLQQRMGGYCGGDDQVAMYWGLAFKTPPPKTAVLSLILTDKNYVRGKDNR